MITWKSNCELHIINTDSDGISSRSKNDKSMTSENYDICF